MRERADKHAAADDATQALVAAEQLRAHYAQIPAMAVAPTLGAAYSSWVLWGAVDNRWLVLGMSGVALLSGLRLLLWRHYFRLPPESQGARRYRVAAVAGSAISGCIWGSAAPLLYPPADPAHTVFLLVLLTLLPIVPLAALAAYMPTLYVYYLVCVAPFVAVLALQPSRSEKMAALLLVMMMAAMLTFARRYSRSLAEAVRLRVRLDERSRALQEAVREKAQFIVSTSHDLRQPVQAMSMFIEALRQGGAAAHDEQALSDLEASLANLRSMLTNTLDISRLDAAVVGPRLEHFALDALLRKLAAEHAPLAAARGLRWRCRAAPAVAYSDPVLVERIVRNLLSNAIKYTQQGGVLLACRRHGPLLRVQVFDTGVGIAVTDQDVVFDEYTQLAHRERSDANGVGLGLAIVRRMSQLLGHRLLLRSVPGRGSVFTIELPRGDAASASAAPSAMRPAAAMTEPSPVRPAPGWVLIIDDDPVVGPAAALLLQRWGHRTAVCRSADEALALLAARREEVPQLLLVDFRLGGGRSGLHAVEAIRRRLAHAVPVILMTGDTAPARLREAYEAGHLLLHKPVDPQRLRLCLAEACAAPPAAP